MEEQMIEPRARVNGGALVRNVGKPTHPNGISAELRTVDNHIVSVKMQEPLQEPLSGLVESMEQYKERILF